MMTVGSLFTGIGGFDLGLERAGWQVVWQCESNAWRRERLRDHWPDVACWSDVRQFAGNGKESPDLICGGFPCQDLSIAGKRAGFQGGRSGLFFEFVRIVATLRPSWVLVENVPGLFSSNRGRDFAILQASLVELGYGVCWRVLDSQYFGVPQRRRRVYVVGHLGADSPEPFLPFLEGGERDPETSSPAREDVAGILGGGSGSRGWCDDLDRSGAFVTAKSLTTSQTRQDPSVQDYVGPLGGGAFGTGRRSEDDPNLVDGVRRLTPTECSRLQGFPDDWLGEPNEPPDSPRYAAFGDAVTVPVAEWIGRRILEGWTR